MSEAIVPLFKGDGEGASANPAGNTTPNHWFERRFPKLRDQYGLAVSTKARGEGLMYVDSINEDFLAAMLGRAGSPDSPTIFLPKEQRFYRYSPKEGIFVIVSVQELAAVISSILLECARACTRDIDLRNLEFKFRKSAALQGVVERAKALLAVEDDYFKGGDTDYIACSSGMLRLADLTLLPFDPIYQRRNKLAVAFDPQAECPRFHEFIGQSMSEDDIDLLQRCCGLLLIGTNKSQVILVVTGIGGSGKGVIVRVIVGIIGQRNLASLRPTKLGDHFELGSFVGKTLLYGADVSPDFLDYDSASILKSLTGGDPANVELKHVNERPDISCNFNVLISANSRLIIRLQEDHEAWERRLRVVEFPHAVEEDDVIAELEKVILETEGPGVLNWMLDGRAKLHSAGWRVKTTERQRKMVENMIHESDSYLRFARDCLMPEGFATLTVDECYDSYCVYCAHRGWTAIRRDRFAKAVTQWLEDKFHMPLQHDVTGENGRAQRGWKGLTCK